MITLPRKRRVDYEGDGESDEEEWRIAYAEDVDEQRAELLRRLEMKVFSFRYRLFRLAYMRE